MIKKIFGGNRGFTLIEIVIVLAIAALLITVVLQAVTSAQRSGRDNTRKQEAGRLVALLEQYASNNNGTYPTTANVRTAMIAYDSTLANKYTFSNTGYVNPPAALSSGLCTAQPGTYTVYYAPNTTNYRDYRIGVCLEVGGLSTVK